MRAPGDAPAGYRARNAYPPALDVYRAQDTAHALETERASRYPTEDYAGVPPISTLLDTADRRAPPPVPESRNYFATENEAFEQETSEARRARSDRSPVGDRLRLIEETNRIVSSLGRQSRSLAEAVGGINASADTVPPRTARRTIYRYEPAGASARLPTLRHEHSLRGPSDLDNAVRSSSTRIDGLGDRNRSPTPPEQWEVMRSTIQPDATLPSAESSFTSAAASQSFTGSSASTMVTDLEDASSVERHSPQSDEESTSSLDVADVCADEDSADTTESLARDMYYREMETPEGRERIAEQEAIRRREGNRFATTDEAPSVDIGFRLIEAALERVEERHRTLRLRGQPRATSEYGPDLTRLSGLLDDDRARQMAFRRSGQLHEAEPSNDAPEAHPVSMPTARMQNETEENLIANIERGDQDLNQMRQIVEMLASRDDVPEEWWSSMGLNLSRARPRRNRETQGDVRDSRDEAELNRVHTGRIERMRDDTRDRASRL